MIVSNKEYLSICQRFNKKEELLLDIDELKLAYSELAIKELKNKGTVFSEAIYFRNELNEIFPKHSFCFHGPEVSNCRVSKQSQITISIIDQEIVRLDRDSIHEQLSSRDTQGIQKQNINEWLNTIPFKGELPELYKEKEQKLINYLTEREIQYTKQSSYFVISIRNSLLKIQFLLKKVMEIDLFGMEKCVFEVYSFENQKLHQIGSPFLVHDLIQESSNKEILRKYLRILGHLELDFNLSTNEHQKNDFLTQVLKEIDKKQEHLAIEIFQFTENWLESIEI